MKFALKVIIWMILLSAPSVLYVHGQVALFKVSYDLNAKADELKEKSETFRRLNFEVEQLKAPRLLEEKMKRLELGLELPKDIQVIRVEPASVLEPAVPIADLSGQAAPGRFDLLGRIIKVAQAKMDN